MKHRYLISLLLLFFLLFISFQNKTVHALDIEHEGLVVYLETQKVSYKSDDKIEVNVSVTNFKTQPVYNLTLYGLPLEDYREASDNPEKKGQDQLAAGATAQLALSFERAGIAPLESESSSSYKIIIRVVILLLGFLVLLLLLSKVRKKIKAKTFILFLALLMVFGKASPVAAIQVDTTDSLNLTKTVMIDGEETTLQIELRYMVREDATNISFPLEGSPLVDPGRVAFQAPTSDKILKDQEKGLYYVQDEILLTVHDGVTRAEVEAMLADYGGFIVGEIELTGDYQIQLSGNYPLSELKAIIADMGQQSWVESLDMHYLFEEAIWRKEVRDEDEGYIPQDSQWASQNWDKLEPGTLHWGVMAINALDAWRRLDSPVNTKVGIIDSMYYPQHEDLHFVRIWNNPLDLLAEKALLKDDPELENVQSLLTHGTHVAGTIAATHNDLGIAGVARQVELYAYSCRGSSTNPLIQESDRRSLLTSHMEIKYGLANLILSGCRVINYSMGFSMSYLETLEDPSALIEAESLLFGTFLSKLIDKGYDFVIVESAGNDGVDAKESSCFGNIRIPQVRQRVIVVGNLGYNKKSLGVSASSNYGDLVDILAPGVDILSTVPHFSLLGKVSSSYEKSTGTSMAAPHVSGIAALCYAVNPAFNGKEVKSFIVDPEGLELVESSRGDYWIADADLAVRRAMDARGQADLPEEPATLGLVMGQVLLRASGGAEPTIKGRDLLIQARRMAPPASREALDREENYASYGQLSGFYEFPLPAGYYELVFSYPGYRSASRRIYVNKNQITYLDDVILNSLDMPTIGPGPGQTEPEPSASSPPLETQPQVRAHQQIQVVYVEKSDPINESLYARIEGWSRERTTLPALDNGYEYASMSNFPASKGQSALWTYESKRMDDNPWIVSLSSLGVIEDVFVYYEDGKLIGLDLETGKVAWENRDFECYDSPRAVSINGVMYLTDAGRPSPGTKCMALDNKGRTLFKLDRLILGSIEYTNVARIHAFGDQLWLKAGRGQIEEGGDTGQIDYDHVFINRLDGSASLDPYAAFVREGAQTFYLDAFKNRFPHSIPIKVFVRDFEGYGQQGAFVISKKAARDAYSMQYKEPPYAFDIAYISQEGDFYPFVSDLEGMPWGWFWALDDHQWLLFWNQDGVTNTTPVHVFGLKDGVPFAIDFPSLGGAHLDPVREGVYMGYEIHFEQGHRDFRKKAFRFDKHSTSFYGID